MDGLADLRMFSEIARSASMSNAADRLGMAPATISGRLKAMEEHFGVLLFRRTTRSLSLTDEGQILLDRALPVLESYSDLKRALCCRKRSESGTVVISSPADFERRCVVPLVAAFSQAFPDVGFQLQNDQDASHDGTVDVAFRIGSLKDSSMITRKLGEVGLVTCAAPAYLERHGIPSSPCELTKHRCLLQMGSISRQDGWTYRNRGRLEQVAVCGIHAARDTETLVDLAVRGHGILRVADFNVEHAIGAGKLISILSEFEPVPQGLHLLSERRRLLPLRTARFMDFAVAHFRRSQIAFPLASLGRTAVGG